MPVPVAKRNDPETSWDAGEDFHKSLASTLHRGIIFGVLKEVGGELTSAEIAIDCDELDRYQVARRLPEMERLGLVERDDARECTVKERKSVTWRVRRGEISQ